MPLELSDMIVALRKEIQQAQAKAVKEDLKFTVDSVEIEAQVTVSMEGSGKAGVKWKFWIFSEADAEIAGKVGHEKVQTIRLTLTPEQDSGKPVKVKRLTLTPEQESGKLAKVKR